MSARPMNIRKALREARTLLGQRAAVAQDLREGHAPCTVGTIAVGAFLEVQGTGASWEEALAAAEAQTRADVARYAMIEGKRAEQRRRQRQELAA